MLALAIGVLAAGAVGGLLAGLLGVGGGIVIVPLLEFALGRVGVDSRITMNMAVATSMATIIPTAISSARAHARRGAVDGQIVRRWAAPIVVGALLGAGAAAHVNSRVLAAVFAVVALLVALKMLLPLENVRVRESVPVGWGGGLIAVVVGMISAVMGIGGGTLSVPLMTLCGLPIHRAVGTAALLGLWISVPATAGFLIARPVLPTPPFTIGYLSLVGFALIAPVSWCMAPLGSRLAHALSKRTLSRLFGLFLLLVGIRMAWRSLA